MLMRPLDYAAIRSQIPIRRVLDLLDWEPISRCGSQWRGNCPCCGPNASPSDRHSRFSVHVSRNVFQCFRCRARGNQLDLWAAATGDPLYRATLDLCRHLGIRPITLPNPQPQNNS